MIRWPVAERTVTTSPIARSLAGTVRDTARAPVSIAGDMEPVRKTTRWTWKAYAAATSTQSTRRWLRREHGGASRARRPATRDGVGSVARGRARGPGGPRRHGRGRAAAAVAAGGAAVAVGAPAAFTAGPSSRGSYAGPLRGRAFTGASRAPRHRRHGRLPRHLGHGVDVAVKVSTALAVLFWPVVVPAGSVAWMQTFSLAPGARVRAVVITEVDEASEPVKVAVPVQVCVGLVPLTVPSGTTLKSSSDARVPGLGAMLFAMPTRRR